MKLVMVVLFSTLIWPSPFMPTPAKKPMSAHNASDQVKMWEAKNSRQHVQLLTRS